MKRSPISEAEMAAAVVAELQRRGFDTYEEVYSGARCDIVGLNGPVVVAVECKTSLSLQLLDQMLGWKGHASFIIGAVPERGSSGKRAARTLLRHEGFGLWEARGRDRIDVWVKPRMFRQIDRRLRDACVSENRSGASLPAGSPGGGYFTPFRDTCNELLKIVNAHPDGIMLREALTLLDHHYSSDKVAMSSLPKLIRTGVIKGIRVNSGTPLKIYPEPREASA